MSCATKRVQLLRTAQAMCGTSNRERLNENTRERREGANWRFSVSPAVGRSWQGEPGMSEPFGLELF
jgi:hypothetical protein